MIVRIVAAAIVAMLGPTLLQAAPRLVYKDPAAVVSVRVEDLLGRMTLEEKVAQMLAVWEGKVEIFDQELQFDPAKAAAKYPNGFGTFARPQDLRGAVSPRLAHGRDARATVKLVNAIQHYAMKKNALRHPGMVP